MKIYFNRSMYFLSIAFVAYFLFDIYREVNNLLNLENEDLLSWNTLIIIKSLLIIVGIFLFIKFMTVANSNQLFSNKSSKLWTYSSVILLVVGLISFIELRFNEGSSMFFATSIFLSSFCIAMSKIFKEGTVLKQENDLTI